MGITENMEKNIKTILSHIKTVFYWLFLSILLGLLCGLIGTGFARGISFMTQLRERNGWLIYLLPVLGLASVLIYQLCHVRGVGINQVFESVNSEKEIPILLAPAIFLATLLTHFGGGSAGREGAALQIGGSISASFSKIFKLDYDTQHILTICGMGALFSALFGTPLTACVFVIEVLKIGKIRYKALFPTLISSLTAHGISKLLGIAGEHFVLTDIPALDLNILWRVTVTIALCAFVSWFFCETIHFSEKLFKRFFKNDYLRIAVGGILVIVLTILFRTTDYNGGGMEVIQHIFEGESAHLEAFAMKILFTAITIGAGFKGGEIVPSMFIGATLGASAASLLGLSSALGAAVGMIALFCGVTNCPVAALLLSAEMFGIRGVVYFVIAVMISFILSGHVSLYTVAPFSRKKGFFVRDDD